MTDQNPTEKAAIEEAVALRIADENKLKGGTGWFFWIAALSVLNSTIALSQGEWSFMVGLGVTQIIDGIAMAAAEGAESPGGIKAFAYFLSLVAASLFVLIGVLARRKKMGVIVVGMVLYALDGLIFLLVRDFFSFGFHVFALFGIFGGYKAGKRLLAREAELAGAESVEATFE